MAGVPQIYKRNDSEWSCYQWHTGDPAPGIPVSDTQWVCIGADGVKSAVNNSDFVAGFQLQGTVLVDNSDTTPGFLASKFVAGSNVTLTVNNAGSNETMTIAATGGGGGAVTAGKGVVYIQPCDLVFTTDTAHNPNPALGYANMSGSVVRQSEAVFMHDNGTGINRAVARFACPSDMDVSQPVKVRVYYQPLNSGNSNQIFHFMFQSMANEDSVNAALGTETDYTQVTTGGFNNFIITNSVSVPLQKAGSTQNPGDWMYLQLRYEHFSGGTDGIAVFGMVVEYTKLGSGANARQSKFFHPVDFTKSNIVAVNPVTYGTMDVPVLKAMQYVAMTDFGLPSIDTIWSPPDNIDFTQSIKFRIYSILTTATTSNFTWTVSLNTYNDGQSPQSAPIAAGATVSQLITSTSGQFNLGICNATLNAPVSWGGAIQIGAGWFVRVTFTKFDGGSQNNIGFLGLKIDFGVI